MILVVATIHPQICLKAHGLFSTSETYIGQDLDGSTAVAAGEFVFESSFTNQVMWYQQGDAEIGEWDDASNVDVSHTIKYSGVFTYDIDDVRGDSLLGQNSE